MRTKLEGALHISEVMEEYLTTLETQATLNQGGSFHAQGGEQ